MLESKNNKLMWMPRQTKTFSFPAAVDSNCIILAQSALVEPAEPRGKDLLSVLEKRVQEQAEEHAGGKPWLCLWKSVTSRTLKSQQQWNTKRHRVVCKLQKNWSFSEKREVVNSVYDTKRRTVLLAWIPVCRLYFNHVSPQVPSSYFPSLPPFKLLVKMMFFA